VLPSTIGATCAALTAERDRYKAALEEINKCEEGIQDFDDVLDIASIALDPSYVPWKDRKKSST
jgi:hypothetical protein